MPLAGTQNRLLSALAWMAAQYLKDGDILDSHSMAAGEDALAALAEHGLVEVTHGGRCGRWTEAGRRLLDERRPPVEAPTFDS